MTCDPCEDCREDMSKLDELVAERDELRQKCFEYSSRVENLEHDVRESNAERDAMRAVVDATRAHVLANLCDAQGNPFGDHGLPTEEATMVHALAEFDALPKEGGG